MELVALPADAQSPGQTQAQSAAPVVFGPPHTNIDPAVVGLLKQAIASYQKLYSYQHKEEVFTASNGIIPRVTLTLAMERPNKLSVKSDNGPFSAAVSDGRKVILYDPDTSEYTQKSAPAALKDIPDITYLFLAAAPVPAFGSALVERMLAGDVLNDPVLVNMFTNASVAATVQKNSKKVQPMVLLPSGHAEDGSLTLDFDVDTHLLQEVVLKTPQGSLTENLSDIKLDQPLPEARFQYTLPRQVKLVDEFMGSPEALEKAAAAKFQGKPAPEFTLKDRSGKEYKLSSLKGKVVIVDFWASWCAPCRMVMPSIQEIHEKLASQGVQVLAVNTWDARSDFDSFVKANPQYTMPFLLDPAQQDQEHSVASKFYGVQALPTTVMIDQNGIVRVYDIAVHERDFYLSALKKLGLNIVLQ
jgi:thiol-disulfide isomerase/thioredoxin/outer membrane lipoprotein-sorting protein